MAPTRGRWRPDAYYIFLALVFSGLGFLTIAMLAIAIWLFRRNRRLPRLVKGRRTDGSTSAPGSPSKSRTRRGH